MINTEEITLKARHFNLAGRLFFPENFDKSIAHPAIVVTHPTSADMNQTSSIYATKLAENGFLTLAYDASYQGQSEGEPRYIEDPASRTNDIMYAIDYLDTLPFVDNDVSVQWESVPVVVTQLMLRKQISVLRLLEQQLEHLLELHIVKHLVQMIN